MYELTKHYSRIKDRWSDEPDESLTFDDLDVAINAFGLELTYTKATAKDFWMVELKRIKEDEHVTMLFASGCKSDVDSN